MQLSIENLGSSQLLHNESESEELGPSCLRPLYKGQSGDEHLVVGPIYHRPQRKGEYDHLLYQDSLAQSERFKNLKPEVVFSLLGERRKYAYLKKFAIQRLQDNIREQLEILYNLNKCKNLYQEPEELQTHNVFSWFMEDFFKRRQLKAFIWLDILQRTSAECLNIFKFKQDIEQLQKFLQLIFEGLFSNMDEEEIDVYQHIVKALK